MLLLNQRLFLVNAAFVIAWLICINPTDLQNAFVPAFIVTTALTIGLTNYDAIEHSAQKCLLTHRGDDGNTQSLNPRAGTEGSSSAWNTPV